MTSKNGDDYLVLIYVVLTSGLLRLIFGARYALPVIPVGNKAPIIEQCDIAGV